ncbi:MAG: hypothetical protein ACK40X_08955 [Armatimonadota bacterium]
MARSRVWNWREKLRVDSCCKANGQPLVALGLVPKRSLNAIHWKGEATAEPKFWQPTIR